MNVTARSPRGNPIWNHALQQGATIIAEAARSLCSSKKLLSRADVPLSGPPPEKKTWFRDWLPEETGPVLDPADLRIVECGAQRQHGPELPALHHIGLGVSFCPLCSWRETAFDTFVRRRLDAGCSDEQILSDVCEVGGPAFVDVVGQVVRVVDQADELLAVHASSPRAELAQDRDASQMLADTGSGENLHSGVLEDQSRVTVQGPTADTDTAPETRLAAPQEERQTREAVRVWTEARSKARAELAGGRGYHLSRLSDCFGEEAARWMLENEFGIGVPQGSSSEHLVGPLYGLDGEIYDCVYWTCSEAMIRRMPGAADLYRTSSGKQALFLGGPDVLENSSGGTLIIVNHPADYAVARFCGLEAVGLVGEHDASSFVAEYRDLILYARNEGESWCGTKRVVVVSPGCDEVPSIEFARAFESVGITLLRYRPAQGSDRPRPTPLTSCFADIGRVDLRRRVELESEPYEKDDTRASDLPTIDASQSRPLDEVSRDAWRAIQEQNQTTRFVRCAGLPARIEKDEQGTVTARSLDKARMHHVLARAANWTRMSGNQHKPIWPPPGVVTDLLATPYDQIPLPILTRIVEAPVFASDGSIQTEPGYHERSRTLYAPPPGFELQPVAKAPSQGDVQRAVRLIDELLCDFPFVSPAERAHAIALLVLPFVRDLIDGGTPLHLIEKPAAGTGGSLLAEVLMIPAVGRPVPVMTEARTEDEWRKRIIAILRGARSVVLIDNLSQPLKSAALSAAITASRYQDRLLGVSEDITVDVRCAWVATGNNPELSHEIARRTIRIRLDARVDRPWQGRKFRHSLPAWAYEHRSELVWAALTIASSWLANGRPLPSEQTTLGGFEAWANTMGGILANAGISGFLENLSEFYADSDHERDQHRNLVDAWWARYEDSPVAARDLFGLVDDDRADGTEGVHLDLGDGRERSRRTRLGMLLSQLRDQVINGKRITRAKDDSHAGVARWRLVSTE